jgi:hypothetical protein
MGVVAAELVFWSWLAALGRPVVEYSGFFKWFDSWRALVFLVVVAGYVCGGCGYA